MALFNINQPTTTQSAKRRNYQGSKLNTLKLGIYGSRPDGSSSIFGKIVSNGLPVAAGIVSAYYTGNYALGSKIGNAAVKGLDKLAANQLDGTDAAITNANTEAQDDRTRQTIDSIGNIAGTIYNAAGGPTYGSSKSSEQKLFDESMKGVSDSSISEYLQSNDSDFNLASSLSGLSSIADIKGASSNINFDPSRLDPNSALARFYSNPQQGLNLGSGLNNFSSASINAGQNIFGQTSSSLGDLGGGYRALDDRKKKTGDLPSFFGYSSLNGFADGGKSKDFIGGMDYKIYDKNDKVSEDLFMVDKNTAKEHGLDEILSRISTSQMRYGETIFDQESTLIQEGILKSGLSEDKKKRLLGDHIYSELLTHSGREVGFANGGKTKPKSKPKLSKYFSTGVNTADITNAKNIYNQWAQTKGLPTLSSSSTFTDDDAIAFANFNADRTNLRKLQVDSTPYLDGATNSTRALVSKIGLGEFMPELKVQPLESIAGYNKKGQAVYSDQVEPTILDKASNKLLVANDDYFPTAVDSSLPEKPISSTQVNGREARATAFRNNNLVGNLSSLATIGVGGLLASEQQPRYTPTAEYTKMRDDIYARQNQGLSAAENAQLSQNLSSNYANGINSIRQIGGGGATQGSVLGALQGLSSNVDKGLLSNSILNINAQRQNQDNYQRTVLQDLNLDRQQFAADAANSANIRDNGLALLSQGTQELYDQNLFNQSYGPNSLYTDLQESQLAGRDKYNTLASLQTELALENLRKQAGQTIIPRINSAPVNRLPTITVPNFNI